MRPIYYNNHSIIKVSINVAVPPHTVTAYVNSDGYPINITNITLVQDFPQPIFIDGSCCSTEEFPCNMVTCSLPLMLDSPYVIRQVSFFNSDLAVEMVYFKVNGVTVLANELFFMAAADIVIENIGGFNIYTNLFDWLQEKLSQWLGLELSGELFGFEHNDIVSITRNDCDVATFELKLVSTVGDEVGFDDYTMNQGGYTSVTSADYEDESVVNYYKGVPVCR